MKYKTELIKYLDRELGKKQAEEVEKLLQSNQELKAQFGVLANKKRQTLDALNLLNPDEHVSIPEFKPPGKPNNKRVLKSRFSGISIWRYAATIAILFGLALSYLLFTPDEPDINAAKTTAINKAETTQDEFEDLNFYISPNRNWNNRELVWTIIEKE